MTKTPAQPHSKRKEPTMQVDAMKLWADAYEAADLDPHAMHRQSSKAAAAVIAQALAERDAEIERLREAINGAITEIEGGRLYETMCCSGYQCGCRGSSNADLLIWSLRNPLGATDAK